MILEPWKNIDHLSRFQKVNGLDHLHLPVDGHVLNKEARLEQWTHPFGEVGVLLLAKESDSCLGVGIHLPIYLLSETRIKTLKEVCELISGVLHLELDCILELNDDSSVQFVP